MQGETLREVFGYHLAELGSTVLVHKNYGRANQATSELRALKTNEKNSLDKVKFQFPDVADIEVGDVIQVKSARDLWRVTELEDKVNGDVLMCFEARVEKINSASSTQQRIATAPIIISNSPGTNFNIGSGSIRQEVSWLKQIGQEIDKTEANFEQKQKAKSLLTQISENKLLNTIIGAAVGELTKAALPDR